jgi:hypothetical protein
MQIPLVWLDQFTAMETTVRIWPGPNSGSLRVAERAHGPWSEIAPQAVRESPELPSLALVATGIDLPLELVLEDVAGGPLTGTVLTRIWNQVLVNEQGQQLYRIRGLLQATHAQNVDVELPVSPAAGQFQAMLDGKRLSWTVPDPAGAGQSVRLHVTAEPNHSVRVLEMTYSIDAASGRASPWIVTLLPPRWGANAIVPPAWWQIGFADGRAALALTTGADFACQWIWDRGLLRTRPALTNTALSRMFADIDRSGDLEATGDDTALVALTAAQAPMRFFTVPRSLAWLICSLGVIACGFALVTLSGRARLLLAGGIVLAVAALAIVADQAITTIFVFSEPGLVMLIPLGLAWFMLHKLNRRQPVFLPRGVRPEAVPVMNGTGAHKSHGRLEPTTVDAPVGPP